MFTIYGCYIQFQFTFFTALYYFHHPSGNASLSENASPPQKNPIKILKLTPSKMAGSISQAIKDQPLREAPFH